ncbi:hypothetical protein AA0Z99_00245 [Agrococcus sp. 1P02AA]|uniref:hypothetical protein n=1 Tax=Agrococcus sp. 1P02AA TaxID=3132259 RepID=UPI0039A73C4F
MTIDTHGRAHRPAGSPASTGGQFAPQAAPAGAAELGQPLGMTLPDHTHILEHRGTFANGYTSEDIDRVLAPLEGYEIVAVWDDYEDDMMTGDSELIGRDRDAHGRGVGPWRRLAPEAWEWLHEPHDGDRHDDARVPDFLDDDPYERQDLDTLPRRTGSNVSLNEYDPDVAFTQMVGAGYSPAGAREAADSASSYETALDYIVMAEGR